MSPAEIAWRIQGLARDVLDQCRFALDLLPSTDSVGNLGGAIAPSPAFRLSDIAPGDWAAPNTHANERAWLARLLAQADEIAGHRLSFFDLKSHHLGDPIDWNRDHAAGKPAPLVYSQKIDYRDFRITGDCKLVWEPNRHHQFVVLARAYRVTGDGCYAQSMVAQLDSWLRQNPFWTGMNWRSPLELGIRLINWVWAIDLIRDSGLLSGELRRRIVQSVYLHCWEIRRKYSRGSSANNHLIGEAAGVFVASAYFDELPHGARWRDESRAILLREIQVQSYADGCTREQALGYQLFVLEFYVACGMMAKWIGEDFPREYWSRVEKMIEFLGFLSEGGGPLPLFGDCDDGYVLDLGRSARDPGDLLCIGAVLFGRADFKVRAGEFREPALWLLGRAGRERFDALATPRANAALASRTFPESGYHLLQCGTQGSPDQISVLFDCAELGFGAIAAHGHADALSFTLRAFGTDVLVDPGTYDYFTFPEWRSYFRSTRAHNTVEVDEVDQSLMYGPFMWGSRAQARCISWQSNADGASVSGEHDGYQRLVDPVTHRRALELDGKTRTLTVRDHLLAADEHRIAVHFHFSEVCVVGRFQSNTVEIAVAGERVSLAIDPRLSIKILRGSDNPIAGWISRGYHRKSLGTTVVAHALIRGDVELVSRILLHPPRQ